MNTKLRQISVLLLLMVGVCIANAAPVSAAAPICSFKNPLLTQGQDPSVVYRDGFYYLVQSNNADNSIGLRKSATLTGLSTAQNQTIWAAPPNTMYSREIWAPELLYLRGTWYIYFAADDGDNHHHSMYTLKAATADPMGTWEFMGGLFEKAPYADKWAIDLTAFELDGTLYAVWSGSSGDDMGSTFPQVMYIAPMDDPLTITAPRVLIINPSEPWESSVQPIAEGAEPYIYGDTVSIVYSADASWTRHYKLALLTLEGDDPLDPDAWVKKGPVFAEVETTEGAVYGVGHNSMPVLSPDGKEWWQVYHAKARPQDGWEDRDVRIQRMTWNADGTPNFGTPIPASVGQTVPSGETCGLQASLSFDTLETDDAGHPIMFEGDPILATFNVADNTANSALALDGNDAVDLGRPLVDTAGSYTLAARIMLADPISDYTLFSQEGGLFSAFRLHTTEDGHLAFTTYDQRGDVAAQAISPDSVNSNSWYDVAVVRDAIAGEIVLYVNGETVATTPFIDGWSSLRSFVIGAGKEKGKRQHYFVGAVDDVRIYNGALSAEDVAGVFES